MKLLESSAVYIILALLFAQNAFCEQIVIRDCSNFIRASSIVPEDSLTTVIFTHKPGAVLSIQDAKSINSPGLLATKNNETESLFSNITTGDWIACGGEFEKVDFINNSKSNSSGFSLLAAGTGILGGASVIAFGNQGGSDSENLVDSLDQGAATENTTAANSSPNTNSASSSSEAATRCLNDSNIADMSQSE